MITNMQGIGARFDIGKVGSGYDTTDSLAGRFSGRQLIRKRLVLRSYMKETLLLL
ncbi:MAG: hypothetical protein PHQ09_01740 [Actinomycetota bacterium]|nr:hypothetical protein [Actinomycetota bacterium]